MSKIAESLNNYYQGISKPDEEDLANHKKDGTAHVTATERNAWNAKQNAPETAGSKGQVLMLGEDGKTPVWGTVSGGSSLVLDSIKIAAKPTKTAYKAGEVFDPTGMVVTADYSIDNVVIAKDKEVTGYSYPTGGLAAGTTSVTITYAEGGVSKTAAVTVSVTKTNVTIPTYNGSLTYNGSAQSPTFTNDPGSLATKSGNTSETNASTGYKTRFTLNNTDLYQWADGTTSYKEVSWSIARKAPTISASPSSVTLNPSNLTATATITTDGDGTLQAPTSSDSTVATGSISGKTVTISHVNRKSGTATITVLQAAGTNYSAGSVTITVTAKFVSIYGVQWDGSSSSVLSRTDAAASFADPVPYVAGASSYGSPFDNLMPWSGMTKQTESDAGVMVKIPKFWYKLTQSGKTISIQIADGAVDGYSVCPACMDRGDGKGERDYVLVGRYHCAASTYKSTSGVKPQVSMAQANFRTNIHNLGSNIYMMDFATRFTIWLLYIVEFANWNSQATIGKGCSETSASSSAVFNMGYTDSMPYHTGTTQSARTSYGGTQYRYLEGLWDNCYDRLTGCYNSSSGLMVTVNPANYAENSGGVSVGTPVSGWIAGLTVSTSGPFPCFINSSTSGGGENAYVCDDWYFNASSPVVYVGGNYSQGGDRGLFCVNCTGLTVTSDNRGSRLQKFP